MTPWAILRIEPTGDERDIKRAYARLLKNTRPEDDPAAFQELRDAYEYALNHARDACTEELEAAPVLPAVPQDDQDPVFGLAVARWQPSAEAPQEAQPDPAQIAERLWAGFLRTATIAPRAALAAMAGNEDMLDLRVRENVELDALRYCATDDCPDEVREAIADFYGWQSDPSFIARAAAQQTGDMLARLRAQQSLAWFRSRAAAEPAVKAILADTAGSGFGRTFDAGFTKNMQELIATIRFHHPDMLYSRLDGGVFEVWERRVEGRRYFIQTALHSAVAGGALWLLTMFVLMWNDLQREYTFISLVSCELFAFTLVGWLVAYPPAALAPALVNWHHQQRFRPAWQFGWIGLYAAGAACLAIPAPPLVVSVLVTAALLVALGGAILANWGIVNRWGFLLASLVGLGAGLNMADNAVDGHGPWAWALAVTCAMLLLYRGGFDFCQWLGIPDRRLLLLRGAWLAGAAVLIAAIHVVPLTHAAWIVVAFLWLTAGMLLSNPSIPHFLPFLGAAVVRAVLLDQTPIALPAPLPALTVFLIAVAAFMAVNMLRAATHQTHFS